MTKLERFIRRRRIKPAQLARASGVSRKRLYEARTRHLNVSLEFMQKVAAGCEALTQSRVSVSELFEIESPRRKAS